MRFSATAPTRAVSIPPPGVAHLIAIAKQAVHIETLHESFLEMLPAIERYARQAFRGHDPVEREERVAAVVADAFVAFRRLTDLGRSELAYATPLARYAVRHVRSGRRVGSPLNKRDVLSPANRRVVVEPLPRFPHGDGEWQEILVEDRRSETEPRRQDARRAGRRPSGDDSGAKRRIAVVRLGDRGNTLATAKKFGLTAGRISQLRRELQASWRKLQGEPIVA